MSLCLSCETHRNKSSQNSSQVCSQLLLSARCSGTMTSILLDISVEIRIFLKKDISHRKGLRLISLSRSNRVSLMFGYAGMKVAGLELCWRIAILPGLFSSWTLCFLDHFRVRIQLVYYYRIQSKCVVCWKTTSQRKELIYLGLTFLLCSPTSPFNYVLLEQLL